MAATDHESPGMDGAPALPAAFEHRIYEAIRVQRPAVIAHIKGVRRARPDASPAEVIKIIESRYLAAVTTASASVGGSATIPGVGTGIAVGLTVADLLLFFEMSALFALSVAEIHGLTVNDSQRAEILIIGMTLGDGNQQRVVDIVASAAAAGATGKSARNAGGAAGLVGSAAKAGTAVRSGRWGDAVVLAVPAEQLNPLLKKLLTVGATKLGAKASGGAIAKILPFGIGAVVGGTAAFFFGKSVVAASRSAFSEVRDVWPEWLALDDAEGDDIQDPPKALLALRATADSAKDFAEEAWNKVGALLASAASVFSPSDCDGDGIPEEPRAVTVARSAGDAIAGAARTVGDGVASLFKPRTGQDTASRQPDDH